VAATITRPGTTCFLLVGFTEGLCISNKTQTIKALKDAIRREVAVFTDVTLPDDLANLQTRMQKCLGAGWGHFQHVR
jgi:predicted transglutaminase-like protease